MKPFLRLVAKPAHVAHRGGSALAPENTMPAFRGAVETWRTDLLELDVHLSRDGVPVVMHDDLVDRTTSGSGPVVGLTLAELRALDAGHHFTPDGGRTFPFRGRGVTIPTLDEVLAAFPTPVLMEIKQPTAEAQRAVVDVLRARGALGRVCLGAVSDPEALALAALVPEACLFFPERAGHAFLGAVMSGGRPDRGPFDVLAPPLEALGPDPAVSALLAACHAHGIAVHVWTINDPSDMRRCLRLGFDGIISDRIDELRRALDEAKPSA